MNSLIRQHDAKHLAAGYSRTHRFFEIASIAVFFLLNGWLLFRLGRTLKLGDLWWTPFAALVGFLGADFISGLVHWGCDTWGTPDVPIIGKAFIRTFREHHVDPQAITRHDFIETNGDNCMTVIFPLASTWWLPIEVGSVWMRFIGVSMWVFSIFVFLTSQIHKWSHQTVPSRFVSWMQRYKIILSPEHHDLHHQVPFNKHYCITSGWLNAPLGYIQFFPIMEKIITTVTGALPRADDIGKIAAMHVAEKEGITPSENAEEPTDETLKVPPSL